MLLLPITTQIRALAAKRCLELPVYAGSHRGTAANEVGCMGEVLIEQLLRRRGVPCESVYSTGCDLLVDGLRAEVKTKERTVMPRAEYEVSVPNYNRDHQQVDLYFFVSLKRRPSAEGMDRFVAAHFCGWCDSETLADIGKTVKAGVEQSNGTKFWTDATNVRIDQLNDAHAWLW